MRRESQFQRELIRDLEERFPGCFILKNDSGYSQGIPDLAVLYRNKWAMLEVKAYRDAPQRPNQDYYVEMFNEMSFGAFIYPENKEDVLNDLQSTFQPRRATRSPQRQQVPLAALRRR